MSRATPIKIQIDCSQLTGPSSRMIPGIWRLTPGMGGFETFETRPHVLLTELVLARAAAAGTSAAC